MKFTFTTLSPTDICTKLERICKAEDRQVDEDVLRSMAKKARGSLRDAESLLELVFTYTESPTITQYDAGWLVSTEDEKALEVFETLCSTTPVSVYSLVDKFYQAGFNLSTIASTCVEIATDMLIIKQGGEIFHTRDVEERLKNISWTISESHLLVIMQEMSKINKDDLMMMTIALAEILLNEVSEEESSELTAF